MQGTPAPKGRLMHIARRVRAPKGAACKGAPVLLGRRFQIARRVRAIALVLPWKLRYAIDLAFVKLDL